MEPLQTQQLDLAGPAHKQIYGNSGSFQSLKNQAQEDQASALRPVAEQFEAMFLSQLLKQSRQVSFDDKFIDGENADFYKDWRDKQMAQDLSAKGSLGLADMLVEELSPKLEAVSPQALEAHRAQQQAQMSDPMSDQEKGEQANADQASSTLSSATLTTEQQLNQRALLP